jgi:hypothetical protein
MTVINRRAAGIAALVLLAVGLTACGDSEPDQRKAFIAFLQEVNQRMGVHFLRPKPEEEKAFGAYLRDYTVITDFSKDFGAVMTEHEANMQKLGVGPDNQSRTLEQMIARRPTYQAIKEETARLIQVIETLVTKANTERSTLREPDDLKAIYDKAFGKLITAPTRAMINSEKALIEFTDSSARVVDYINDHRAKITLSGTQVQTNDTQIRTELGALFAAQKEVLKRFQDAQREGQRLVDGAS